MVHLTSESSSSPSTSKVMAPSKPETEGASSQEIVKQQLFVAKTVLLQAVDLLNNYLTSDEQLTVNSKFLPGSTIGKHLRHARDHFVLLLQSTQGQSPHILSYDTRIRNTPMEGSIEGAQMAILETIRELEERVPSWDFEELISLQAVTPYLHTFTSTIGRELWFASLHCVHHWSMVRVIAGELGIKLTEDFGFAPSTLVYQDRDAPLGKGKL